MRRIMTKEVTKTTVKISEVINVDGVPQANELEPLVLLGNVSLEKAQKEVSKKFGANVTVFEIKPETQTYEMDVTDFIKYARVKQHPSEMENVQEDHNETA